MTSSQGHDTHLGHWQQLCEIISKSNKAVRSYVPDTDFGYVCTVTLTFEIWPWVKVMTHPWVMDNVWSIVQIHVTSEKLRPRHGIWLCVYCDLDLRDMTLFQGYDTSLGHGQQLCEILSKSNKAVRSYGPDTDFGCVCALWPWPWRYDLMSRSWHTLGSWTTTVWNITQIQWGGKKLWPGQDEQTDRRTDRRTDGQGDSYIPPKFCLRGV